MAQTVNYGIATFFAARFGRRVAEAALPYTVIGAWVRTHRAAVFLGQMGWTVPSQKAQFVGAYGGRAHLSPNEHVYRRVG